MPFVVIGVTIGSVYGLAALGLVLTYQTSGIFNFAYGAVAAVAVFVFYFLHTEHEMAWPLAALICLCVVAPIEGLLLERMARAMADVAEVYKVVATVGLILIVVGIGNIWYGDVSTLVPPFLPTDVFEVSGVFVGWDQATVVMFAFVAAALLYLFFRYMRLGVAMRAAVDNPELLAMTGENTVRVQRTAWIIGTVFASTAGLLLAPDLGLNGIVLTQLVVQAFGAAAIGRLSSLPLTYVGGILIGLCAAISTKFADISWLAGLPAGLPFLVLFLVLIVTPRSKLSQRRVAGDSAVHRSWYAPARVRLAIWAVVIALFGLAPLFAGSRLTAYSITLIFVIMFMALGLVTRTSGQISLCPLAFAAIGAASMSHFAHGGGLPWGLALILAGLVAVPVGALIAVPAVRLAGVFLALATFGFGVLLEKVVYTQDFMFGASTGGIPVPRPGLTILGWDTSSDDGFHFVLLALAVLSTALILGIQNGRLGRLLRGLSDSPTALEAHGTTTSVTKVLVFCISAFFLAIGGALMGSLYTFESGADFTSFGSLQMVVLVTIVLVGDPWVAVIAAVGMRLLPAYLPEGSADYLLIVFGLFAATFAMSLKTAPTVPSGLKRLLDSLGGREQTVAGTVQATAPRAAAATSRPRVKQESGAAPREPWLEVRDLDVRFGGVRAVDDFSMSAPLGAITGLVGPNGAGKTTTLNVCSGLQRPTRGGVFLDGTNASKLSVAARARHGVGRTFQRGELFGSLSVRENLILGREAGLAGVNPLSQVLPRPGDRRETEEAIQSAMAATGIGKLGEVQAGLLSTGEKRLVELARVLSGSFKILLLDEPSSGLHGGEVDRFGETLQRIVEERGVGIVLVEHDMSLVRRICDRVYVLDYGKLIFEGTAEEMLASDDVRAAYLGSHLPSESAKAPAVDGGARRG